jgi:hypothetical protein
MKVLISGNKEFGIAKELSMLYSNANFASRATGFDLTTSDGQALFSKMSLRHDNIIINSALWKFNQTVLLDTVYKTCQANNHCPHIIVIGSTTDRVKNGKTWLYNAEKKALRDYANTCAINAVWGISPKVSYISFGTLSNNQEKHPDRKCLDIKEAAKYIKWLTDQPKHVNINEISIDPMQDKRWHD